MEIHIQQRVTTILQYVAHTNRWDTTQPGLPDGVASFASVQHSLAYPRPTDSFLSIASLSGSQLPRAPNHKGIDPPRLYRSLWPVREALDRSISLAWRLLRRLLSHCESTMYALSWASFRITSSGLRTAGSPGYGLLKELSTLETWDCTCQAVEDPVVSGPDKAGSD